MNKLVKKILVGVMAATMALGSVTTAFAATSNTTGAKPVTKEDVKATNGTTVSTSKKGVASLNAVKKTSAKSVTVSSKVKVGNVTYTVTRIEANAFKNASKATKITLPSTINALSANAFSGAKSLKTIVITSKKTVKVNHDAFKGLDTKKMTIQVKGMSKSALSSFKKALKRAGFKGTVKVA